MSDKFISLGVKEGDSFFLEKGDSSALIDGGNKEQVFPDLFFSVTKKTCIDYVICTHPDNDHIKGIIGFLGNLDYCCKELWIPSYIGLLSDKMLNNPKSALTNMINELTNRLIRFFSDGECRNYTKQNLDKLEEQIFYDRKRILDKISVTNDFSNNLNINRVSCLKNPSTDKQLVEYKSFLLEISKLFSNFAKISKKIDRKTVVTINNEACFHLMNKDEKKLYLKYINLFEKMRRLVYLAAKRYVPIRFFEYNNKRSVGGKPGFLIPINAVEVSLFELRKINLTDQLTLFLLYLSLQNETSLVFFSPKNINVLLSSDSDFSFNSTIPWTKNMIITVPHHGSANNSNFYERFLEEANGYKASWIKTYNHSVKKITDFFEKHSQQKLYKTKIGKTKRKSWIFKYHNISCPNFIEHEYTKKSITNLIKN